MSYQLLEPILEGGVRNSHYFNGRLLTADALRQDQAASRRQRQQLGQAIGAGIVEGLMVSLQRSGREPVLRIDAGLALNREGQALALPQPSNLALVKMEEPRPADAGLFQVCVAPAPGETHTGRHVYLLVMAPASGYRERAPMYDLSANGDSNGRANGCGFRYAVEGVQFRLVRVDLADETVVDADTAGVVKALMDKQEGSARSKLRNRLAHLALGTPTANAFPTDLFSHLVAGSAPPPYGLADRLLVPEAEEEEADMTVHLSRCDVPLALLYWTPSGVQFVDNWAVRRRVIPSYPATAGSPLVDDHRLAEGEAAFLQFQAQLAALLQEGAVRASTHFRYLPAAGFIPVVPLLYRTRRVYETNFFSGLTTREPVYIEGDQVQPLLRESYRYDPVDLQSDEFFWLYQVRDNREAIATGRAAPTPYLLFASGHMPFRGQARYDVARSDYSNAG